MLIKYADVEDKRQFLKDYSGDGFKIAGMHISSDFINDMSDEQVNSYFKNVLREEGNWDGSIDRIDEGVVRISDDMVATAVNNKYEAIAEDKERAAREAEAKAIQEREDTLDAYEKLYGSEERAREIYEQTN